MNGTQQIGCSVHLFRERNPRTMVWTWPKTHRKTEPVGGDECDGWGEAKHRALLPWPAQLLGMCTQLVFFGAERSQIPCLIPRRLRLEIPRVSIDAAGFFHVPHGLQRMDMLIFDTVSVAKSDMPVTAKSAAIFCSTARFHGQSVQKFSARVHLPFLCVLLWSTVMFQS